MAHHYSDYFDVPQVYRANMTRAIINESPERWLDFYPHEKYIDFLETLFVAIHEGSKSVWLTGNFGTGKTNAALVTQKLYMDDIERVRQWFKQYNVNRHNTDLLADLEKQRAGGTLVVYDYNASGLEPTTELIVRIEKAIIEQLMELGLKVPLNSNVDQIISRLRREGDNFFKIRDKISDQLSYIPSDVYDIEAIVKMIQDANSESSASLHVLEDIQKILHTDGIFLNVDVNSFKKWIREIREQNSLERIIFLFDEFSDFIEENKTQLKTFEDITESPGVDQFYLIPVTHMGINAYYSDNADSASRSTNRFYFKQLQMPNNIAFELAAGAMRVNPTLENEWAEMKNKLWASVQQVADKFNENEVTHQSFHNILPIHPMAGYLLKTLSESVGANQRSIFEYLKGSANGREFQEFIKVGGPEEYGKQLLTVDYLWKYFMERDDLGKKKELDEIKLYYNKIRNSTYRAATDDDPLIRVLKAIMLFVLVCRLNKNGHARLQATVENIELSFVGDGSIANVSRIIKEFEEQHCLSIMNGNIELYISSIDDSNIQSKIEEYLPKFHDLLSEKAQNALIIHTKQVFNQHPTGRFDIRVTGKERTSLQFLSQAQKEKYGKDTGQVCVWFSIAKDHDDGLGIPEKINKILSQTKDDYRIIMVEFDGLTFCDKSATNWEEYVRLYVKHMTENDSGVKNQLKKSLDKMEFDWTYKMKMPSAKIIAYYYEDDIVHNTVCTWQMFKNFISERVKYMLPYNTDELAPIITAYSINGLKKYALAGIDFNTAEKQTRQVVQLLQKGGVTADKNWFDLNPDHPLSHIHELFTKKMNNTVGRGSNFSIRKAFIDLRKHPYGMMDNAFSAFTVGFCLKEILHNNYQWTDGKLTNPLDADSLAEIIEDAIKTVDKPRDEKTICKLSKEDKAFVESAPVMFGLQPMSNCTTNETIGYISNKISTISSKVPLWVIPDYIDGQQDPDCTTIREIIEKICLIARTSSKGNTEEKSEAIRDVGAILLNNEGIIKSVAKYMNQVTFKTAFGQYIDSRYPDMNALASSVGDQTHNYLNSILDKAASAASYLWIKDNLDANVSETQGEYKLIQTLKPLVSPSEFVNYKQVVNSLKNAIFERNKIPRSRILSIYPSLADLIDCIESLDKTQNVKTIDEIQQTVAANYNLIENLFYDSKMVASIKIIKGMVETGPIPDSELINLIQDLSSGYSSPEITFTKELKGKIEDYEKKSLGRKLLNRWKEITQSSSPSEWAATNHMPAYFVFFDYDNPKMIIQCISHPEDYSAEKLNAIMQSLNSAGITDVKRCQAAFIDEHIPSKYKGFNISFGSLASYLMKRYSGSPNTWPDKLDFSDYLTSQYKTEIAPQAIAEIKQMNAEELKSKILSLAADNEDIGLIFWK